MPDETDTEMPAWMPQALEAAISAAIDSGRMTRRDAWVALEGAVQEFGFTIAVHGEADDALAIIGELWYRAADIFARESVCLTHGAKPSQLLLLGADGKPVDESQLSCMGRSQVTAARFLAMTLQGDADGMVGVYLGNVRRGSHAVLHATVALLMSVGEQVLSHRAAHDPTMPDDIREAVRLRAAEEAMPDPVTSAALAAATATGARVVRL